MCAPESAESGMESCECVHMTELMQIVSTNLPLSCLPVSQLPFITQHAMQALRLPDRNVVGAACELLAAIVREHENDEWEACVAAMFQQNGTTLASAVLQVRLQ